jgi:cell division protease FtsH
MSENENERKPAPNRNSIGKPKFNIYWIYGLIAVVFIGIQFVPSWGNKTKEITWQQFEKDMLKTGDVAKIVFVNNNKAEIYIKPEKFSTDRYNQYQKKGNTAFDANSPQFYITIPIETFEKKLETAQKDADKVEEFPVLYEERKDHFGDLWGLLFPILILVAIWLFIFRRMGAGGGAGGANIFSIGKSKAKIFDKEEANIKINFKDVAGLEEAKVEITEIVDFLKNPSKYTKLGGKIPKGALLVGPPGTGKTLLAKAVAGEANVPFFSMSGSDFVEMFVGVGASRVRDLFSQAKQKAPCIVFIDEIDAIGRARGRNPNFGSNDERENTLNQLLTEMDGFDTNTGVIILAATNRADILDAALLRAGRFDRQIHVELPDLLERAEIFKVHLRPIAIEENFDLGFLAKQTPGFSGADIANVCNEAALIAARRNKKAVQKQDFLDAIDRIVGGLEKKNKLITQSEKKTIAYHEAGHATISWFLEYAHPLVKVTIVPRGQALGAAWYLPKERQITTTEQILDEICSALGGRASEELNFGKISTGALNDLEKVTKQAYAMVSYFGMSSIIGNICFYDSQGRNEYSFSKPYSEQTAELIDKEAKNLIDIQYKRAIKILEENKAGLIEISELLLEKEVIFSEDLERILGKRKFVEEESVPRSKTIKNSNGENAETVENAENSEIVDGAKEEIK